jgi:hypothetical protein
MPTLRVNEFVQWLCDDREKKFRESCTFCVENLFEGPPNKSAFAIDIQLKFYAIQLYTLQFPHTFLSRFDGISNRRKKYCFVCSTRACMSFQDLWSRGGKWFSVKYLWAAGEREKENKYGGSGWIYRFVIFNICSTHSLPESQSHSRGHLAYKKWGGKKMEIKLFLETHTRKSVRLIFANNFDVFALLSIYEFIDSSHKKKLSILFSL